jgi:hypothetical protein
MDSIAGTRRIECVNVARNLSRAKSRLKMVIFTATWYYENVMTTLTVKIPETLERSIAIAARRERVTKSELVRRAMAKYIAQTGEDHKFQSALDLAGGLIGSVRGGPADLSTNTKYMDDYGK